MSTGRPGHGVVDYVHKANDETLVTELIKDITAINNLSEIAGADQIGVSYIAPGDLAGNATADRGCFGRGAGLISGGVVPGSERAGMFDDP